MDNKVRFRTIIYSSFLDLKILLYVYLLNLSGFGYSFLSILYQMLDMQCSEGKTTNTQTEWLSPQTKNVINTVICSPPLSSLNLVWDHLPEVLTFLNGATENKNSAVSLVEKCISLQAFCHNAEYHSVAKNWSITCTKAWNT